MNTVIHCSIGAFLLAAIPTGSDDPSVWAQWGLAGVVVGVTLLRDWQREQRMSKALEEHQTWIQTALLGALDRNSAALEKVASQAERK